ncbi:MAG: hypothetical protein ACI4OH_10280 [Mitsuokella sp.]|uniref:hypothetical protein n=1 Tax=Mitsuokella sp. TaxID=2049034 RepID=UPI003D7E764E
MDSSILAIILFAVMAILTDKLGGKKKPPAQRPPFPFPEMPRRAGEHSSHADEQLPPPMPQPWGTKAQPEPEKKSSLPFEIPDLKGAPLPSGQTDEGVYREPGTKMQDMLEAYREEMADKAREAAYEEERRAEEEAIRAREEAIYEQQAKLPGQKTRRKAPILPQFTPASIQQSIVMAELLGKPKAYRHKNPYWRK